MKAIRLGVLSAILLYQLSTAPAAVDLPPAAQEVVKQFEIASAEMEKKIEVDLGKARDKVAVELKKLQDAFCKEAKLDEAVAIRDLIRNLQAGKTVVVPGDLPAAAVEVYKQHEEEVAAIYKKAEASLAKEREQVAIELKKVQDAFCKEDKLDEAIAVRDLIRMVRLGVTSAMPDPGYVNNGANDIGRVYYYETTGAVGGGSIYGTDIFTTGSHLAMAAVHSGVLKEGQKGVVKVTILPGQPNYAATTRNGITSSAWNAYHVSFKVERVFGVVTKPVVNTEQPKDAKK